MKKSLLALLALSTLSLTACDNGKTATLETEIQELKTLIVELQKTSDKEISEIRKTAENEISQLQATFAEKLQSERQIAEQKIIDLQAQLATAKQEADNAKKDAETKKDQLSNTLNELKVSFGKSMNEAKSAMATKMTNFGKVLQDVATELKSDGNDIIKVIENAVEEVKKDFAETKPQPEKK